MRIKVVRTPGELRDSIGHRVIVRKDWEGLVESELSPDEIAAAGFHPKQQETFYSILFDLWEQTIVLPATLVVILDDPAPDAD
jgi:hypothetical protein